MRLRSRDGTAGRSGNGPGSLDRISAVGWRRGRLEIKEGTSDSLRAGSVEHAVALYGDAERLREAGDHRRAAKAARRALALFQSHEGRHHPDVAAALLELGRARELGDAWREALGYYLRGKVILGRYVRLRDPDLRRLRVKADRALCGVYRTLGQYRLADRHGRRAIALAEKHFGKRDLDLAGALNDLGMVRKYQGRYAEAHPLYRRALTIVRAAGLGETADAASLYHNLGGIEHARGRYARAEAPARRAVVLRVRALGQNHPTVAADVGALAAIVAGRGRLAEAADLYRRALFIFRRTFGARSYEVGVNLAGLGGVHHASGRLAVAEKLYRQSLAILVILFGKRHVEVAFTLADLATAIWARGRKPEALGVARQALATFRAVCGTHHPTTHACAAQVARMGRETKHPRSTSG